MQGRAVANQQLCRGEWAIAHELCELQPPEAAHTVCTRASDTRCSLSRCVTTATHLSVKLQAAKAAPAVVCKTIVKLQTPEDWQMVLTVRVAHEGCAVLPGE